MKSLYESILDTDQEATERIERSVLDQALEYLKKFSYFEDCVTEFKGDKLYVKRKKDSFRSFYFLLNDKNTATAFIGSTEISCSVSVLNYVVFDNCNLEIRVDKDSYAPDFISNCRSCNITYIPNDNFYTQLAKLVKNTKGNSIILHSRFLIPGTKDIYSYINLNGLDFRDCCLILYCKTVLNNIKDLKVKDLILQPFFNYYINNKIYELNINSLTNNELTIFQSALDEFLSNNNIQSLGLIDNFVQYIDWIIKDKNTGEYIYQVVKSSLKRHPKIL